MTPTHENENRGWTFHDLWIPFWSLSPHIFMSSETAHFKLRKCERWKLQEFYKFKHWLSTISIKISKSNRSPWFYEESHQREILI
jgi:hypothetical protein